MQPGGDFPDWPQAIWNSAIVFSFKLKPSPCPFWYGNAAVGSNWEGLGCKFQRNGD